MSQRQKLNAAARREEARREAERIQKQQRRNRGLLVLGVVLAVVGIAIAAVIIWRGSRETYLDDVARSPAGSDTTGGIPVAADGTAGSADAEAPRLDVYVDVQSPESVAFWQAQHEDLEAMNADGTIALWLHMVGFVDGGINGSSTRPAQAAAVVADQAPESFLPFVDAQFEQRAGGAEKLNDPDLVSIAGDVGIDTTVSDQFDDNLFNDWCVAATDQAERDGVDEVPTVRLDGQTLAADWTADGALSDAVVAALGG